MVNTSRPKKQTTLCFIIEQERILLAMKKRGFGAGKYNGFGGKINQNETIEEATIRELGEESGLTAEIAHLEKHAEIDFYFPHKPEFDQTVHVYIIKNVKEVPIETEEMRYKWFALEKIPYSQMWDDDKYWLPYVLARKKIQSSFTFKNVNEENIVDKKDIIEIK